MSGNPGQQAKEPQGKDPQAKNHTDEINQVFARVELWGVRVGIIGMIVTFALYLTGLVQPFIAPSRLTGLIGGGVTAYVRDNQVPTGWDWLSLIERSDMLSLASLVFMVGVIAAAYVALVPVLIRQGNRIYLGIVIAQLGVFFLAAFGGFGGH